MFDSIGTDKILFNFFEGVEKKNDDLRRFFHRKINRWDAATNLLLVEKRQELLSECQREKRQYVKRDMPFWIEGGKQEAAKKFPRISSTILEEDKENSMAHQFTDDELKKMKVAELLALLTEVTGKVFNKKTRKQQLIREYKMMHIAREN